MFGCDSSERDIDCISLCQLLYLELVRELCIVEWLLLVNAGGCLLLEFGFWWWVWRRGFLCRLVFSSAQNRKTYVKLLKCCSVEQFAMPS